MSKMFSLHKRDKYYYVQFKLPDGSFSNARSSKQTTKGKAEAWAIEFIKSGNVAQKGKITFANFSKDFFSWDGLGAIY